MSVLQGYLKGALWKKQLIASFVERFAAIRCMDFQFHVAINEASANVLYNLPIIKDYEQGAVDSFFRRAY